MNLEEMRKYFKNKKKVRKNKMKYIGFKLRVIHIKTLLNKKTSFFLHCLNECCTYDLSQEK